MYYLVDKNHQLSKAYKDFEENSQKTYNLSVQFMKEMQIEADQFQPQRTNFYIKPTEQDLQNFSRQLTTKPSQSGLVRFRTNSKIQKAWVAFLFQHNHTVGLAPRISTFLNHGFSCSYRAFFDPESECVYAEYHTDADPGEPEGFKIINASQYYAALEKLGEK